MHLIVRIWFFFFVNLHSAYSSDANSSQISAPLTNTINAPLVAQIDISNINKELKVYIEQEIEKGVQTAMHNLAEKILHEKLSELEPVLEENLQQKMDIIQKDIQDDLSTSYIQWGRKTCTSNNTEMIYSGFVGGSSYTNYGSAVNHLCLPYSPEWGIYDGKVNSHPFIGGAVFDIWDIDVKDSPFDHGKYDHGKVACSSCRRMRKSTNIMIPARKECFGGWSKEYDGYLFAGHPSHQSATEYICLDKTPDVLAKVSSWSDKKLLYPVRINCNGAIDCPPYVNGREVTCVVCSQ